MDESRGPSLTAQIVVTKATPLPSAQKGRVTKQQCKDWTPRELAMRTCQHCKTVYASGGFAWRCEHWHEGL
jgi:hypothetical protein